MPRGVVDRDEAAVRVTEQVHFLEAELHAQLFQVGDVAAERIRLRATRSAGAARVEEHERERLAEAAEIR